MRTLSDKEQAEFTADMAELQADAGRIAQLKSVGYDTARLEEAHDFAVGIVGRILDVYGQETSEGGN